jgi:hypothetical protein
MAADDTLQLPRRVPVRPRLRQETVWPPGEAHVLGLVALLRLAAGSRARAGGLVPGEDERIRVGAACCAGRLTRWYALYQLARVFFGLGWRFLACFGLFLARAGRGQLLCDDVGESLDIAVFGVDAEGEGGLRDVGVLGGQAGIELYALAGGRV